MRKVHKIGAILLCVALVLTCLSLPGGGTAVSADETTSETDSEAESSEVLTYEYEGHTLSYETEDDAVTITGCTDADAETTVTELTLPDTINGVSVTAIGDEAFSGYTELSSITLPDTLTEIGSSAFYGCSALASIDLPDGITEIAASTFRDCTSLVSVDFSENLKIIWRYAFYNCTSLQEVCFPDSLTAVYDYAFYNCTDITYILLPANISIRDDNFDQSENLKTVEYAEGCTRPYTEDGWRNGGSFLRYAETLILPSTLSSLRTGTTDLAGVDVTDFFMAFTGTKEIIISEDNPYFSTYDGCIYDIDQEVLYIVPRAAEEITFSPNCTTISNGAFAGCKQITEIVVPDTVTKICGLEDAQEEKYKYGGFVSCYALETLIIPDSVTNIGSSAISGCISLSYVSLYYDGVYYCFSNPNDASSRFDDLTIADASSEAAALDPGVFDLFGDTTVDSSVSDEDLIAAEAQLETIHLPDSTQEIPTGYFDAMTSLTAVDVDADNSVYFSENGILYKYADDASGMTLVRYPAALGSVELADGVAVLGERSYYNCSVVKSFEFPDSVTEVGAQAFYKCRDITVEFGEGLTTIGDEAFYYSMDSKVVLPEGVTSIGTNSFYTIDASCIVYVYPNSYAEEYAIVNELTYRYTSVYGTDLDTDDANGGALGRDIYDSSSESSGSGSSSAGAAVGKKVTVGNAVYKVTSKTAVTYVKSTKKNASKITIPATVKINGKSYKVTAVKASAFTKNKKLKTIVIGKNLKTIGKKAFYNCKNLKKITFKGKNVKKIGTKAFKGTAAKATVKVPKAKKAVYKKLLKKAGLSAKANVK